ncbi:hypothetical protein IM816_00165 [Luteibacter flocculans]|uniref:Peptidase inhibitor I78 family protein n=1 Tax=Luteibacter flocculans TaxID=2780091 RepID=A0ABY4T1U6_9GAMM|nr:hypothetical protein [Luteibacter flocculans]URL58595.1 hypothetical protein IM816_00165 [Luteibacter flocculans]
MMDKRISAVLLTLLVAAPLAASAQTGRQGDNGWTPPGDSSGTVIGAAGGCGITDMPAFAAVIATKPTPAHFSALYSCVQLVLPGDQASMEMRLDNSRYFAELDSVGRIVGGSFR